MVNCLRRLPTVGARVLGDESAIRHGLLVEGGGPASSAVALDAIRVPLCVVAQVLPVLVGVPGAPLGVVGRCCRPAQLAAAWAFVGAKGAVSCGAISLALDAFVRTLFAWPPWLAGSDGSAIGGVRPPTFGTPTAFDVAGRRSVTAVSHSTFAPEFVVMRVPALGGTELFLQPRKRTTADFACLHSYMIAPCDPSLRPPQAKCRGGRTTKCPTSEMQRWRRSPASEMQRD